MIVFLRRIPANIKKYEIAAFLEPALKGGLFAKNGYIEEIKILTHRDKQKNTLEYHGLVRIEPEAAAERVIKKLNGKPINGKHIVVREYFSRNWHNDPRLSRSHPNITFPDRRKADRRRHHLEAVRTDTPPPLSIGDFQASYNERF